MWITTFLFHMIFCSFLFLVSVHFICGWVILNTTWCQKGLLIWYSSQFVHYILPHLLNNIIIVESLVYLYVISFPCYYTFVSFLVVLVFWLRACSQSWFIQTYWLMVNKSHSFHRNILQLLKMWSSLGSSAQKVMSHQCVHANLIAWKGSCHKSVQLSMRIWWCACPCAWTQVRSVLLTS